MMWTLTPHEQLLLLFFPHVQLGLSLTAPRQRLGSRTPFFFPCRRHRFLELARLEPNVNTRPPATT